MTIEEMKGLKKEYGLTNEMISEKSGVPLGTVQKIFGGATTAPRRGTLEHLRKMFEEEMHKEERIKEQSKEYFGEMAGKLMHGVGMAKESVAAYNYASEKPSMFANNEGDFKYPLQGQYTIDDYYVLSENQRMELIDGVIYEMAGPSGIHQDIITEVVYQIVAMRKRTKSKCTPRFAPFDVQLKEDGRTIVQPDVMIYCEPEEGESEYEMQIPDFVLEVLSPSTRKKDMTIKLTKYVESNVREYWIVDPESESVLAYFFDEGVFPKYYTFDDVIPVGVSGGAWEIDFRQVREELERIHKDLPWLK